MQVRLTHVVEGFIHPFAVCCESLCAGAVIQGSHDPLRHLISRSALLATSCGASDVALLLIQKRDEREFLLVAATVDRAFCVE